MSKHKKPPVNNNQTMITIRQKDLEKAADEAREHIKWIAELALQEEFGFGKARVERFRQKMDEIAKKKTFEAWVDHQAIKRQQENVWSIPRIVRMQ